MSITDTIYGPCGCTPIGKPIQISQPYAPGATPVYATYTSDGLGRTLTVALPDGSTTSNAYLGNWTTVTDPAGKWKMFKKDVFGNIVNVVEPDPTHNPVLGPPNPTALPASGILITNYTYDFVNHLIQVTMVRGTVTQNRHFKYNAKLQLSSSDNPETGTAGANGITTYTYNPDGTLATRTDPKTQVTSYTYDAYQRVTKITHGSDASQTVNYTYDQGATANAG